jgi:hypothetical protein
MRWSGKGIVFTVTIRGWTSGDRTAGGSHGPAPTLIPQTFNALIHQLGVPVQTLKATCPGITAPGRHPALLSSGTGEIDVGGRRGMRGSNDPG